MLTEGGKGVWNRGVLNKKDPGYLLSINIFSTRWRSRREGIRFRGRGIGEEEEEENK